MGEIVEFWGLQLRRGRLQYIYCVIQNKLRIFFIIEQEVIVKIHMNIFENYLCVRIWKGDHSTSSSYEGSDTYHTDLPALSSIISQVDT